MRTCFFLCFCDMKRLALILLAILSLSACRRGEMPADVLPADKMVDFLSEAYLLEGFYAVETEYRYDAMTPEVVSAYDDILARHGIDKEAVERSFHYYAEHPDLYQSIHDSVIARLESDMTEEDKNASAGDDLHLMLQ